MNQLITILGPTASGKTTLACELAAVIDGAVLSADSRQIYQGLDIGSGKDLAEYNVRGRKIPYFLIDHVSLREEYNIYRYQQDFIAAFSEIERRDLKPILCGGSGLYLQTVINGFQLKKAPPDTKLRKSLESKSMEELSAMLIEMKTVHNTTDLKDRDRLIRALEIAFYQNNHSTHKPNPLPTLNHLIFGLHLNRKVLKERITNRLKQRLKLGMIEEVENLLKSGIEAEKLRFLGLEYRFITQYLQGELNYNDMYQKLNAAIHNFAKRQMTWFRKMEREGWQVIWLDAENDVEENISRIQQSL